MFLEEGKQSLTNLRTAFETKNSTDFKLFAHKLKSSFLMFDMLEAHAISVTLESVKEDTFVNSEKDLERLEVICVDIFRRLRLKYLK